MKTNEPDERRTSGNPPPPIVTVRRAANADDVEQLLPPAVLARLCSGEIPTRVRQCNVYLSQVIVALDGDSAVGFAAYKPATGPVRVAHELWVDPQARAGPAEVTAAILSALESAVSSAGCSRLFVVVAQSTPLRRILQHSGYSVSLAGAELIWFEKSLADGWHPLESA
jgi:hypothetical protein